MLAGYADGLPDVEAGAPATRGSSSFEPCLVSGVVAAAMVTEAAATAAAFGGGGGGGAAAAAAILGCRRLSAKSW